MVTALTTTWVRITVPIVEMGFDTDRWRVRTGLHFGAGVNAELQRRKLDVEWISVQGRDRAVVTTTPTTALALIPGAEHGEDRPSAFKQRMCITYTIYIYCNSL